MKELINKKYILILAIIFLFDLVTKLAAISLLPFQEHVSLISDKISFYLIYNEGSTGGQAGYLLQNEINKNLTLIFSSVAGFVIIIYVFFIRKKQIKTLYKWLIGFFIYVSLNVFFQLIKPAFIDFEVTSWAASVTSKSVGILIYITLFILINNNHIKTFVVIIISAGLSNLVNHFYFPYQIIDFIYIKGTFELLKIGVFNFADLAFDIGIVGLIITIIITLINKITGKKTAHNIS